MAIDLGSRHLIVCSPPWRWQRNNKRTKSGNQPETDTL
jgi:hypothetical protein